MSSKTRKREVDNNANGPPKRLNELKTGKKFINDERFLACHRCAPLKIFNYTYSGQELKIKKKHLVSKYLYREKKHDDVMFVLIFVLLLIS